MAFRVGAKRSLGGLLCNRVLSSSCSTSGHGFSTLVSKRVAFAQATETQVSVTSNFANQPCGFVPFFRRFSVEASSIDQVSLIRQLRERTSAPIKDVKAALIASNWDIGINPLLKISFVNFVFFPSFGYSFSINAEAAQKDLRKRGKVLASKKSARTAAEGLLALAQNENKAALIELNCETDFVARNEIFQYLVSVIDTTSFHSQHVPFHF